MRVNGEPREIKVGGPLTSDSADVMLQMAIEGAGIIRLGDLLGERALAEGALVELFAGEHDDDPKPLTALVLPHRRNIPRVRAFVDFLKAELRAGASSEARAEPQAGPPPPPHAPGACTGGNDKSPAASRRSSATAGRRPYL